MNLETSLSWSPWTHRRGQLSKQSLVALETLEQVASTVETTVCDEEYGETQQAALNYEV